MAHPRWRRCRAFFLAFTMRLSPARRAIYGIALVMALIGLLKLFHGFGVVDVPVIPFVLGVAAARARLGRRHAAGSSAASR